MVLSEFQTIQFCAGETIFKEGEQGDCAFVIMSGNVSVEKESGDSRLKLATLGPNQMIGEMALVSPGHRTATITAITDCSLLLIEQGQFTSRRNNLDPVMKMVFDVILTRFRNTLYSLGTENEGIPVNTYMTGEMERAISQLHLENDIRRGLAAGEFELYYQPLVCLQTGKLSGAEGLMRWNHPTKGVLQPAYFIPTVEASNLIFELTSTAIDQACKDLHDFGITSLKNVENINPVFVTFNVSARDLNNDRFYEQICQNLTDYSLPADSLKLEVTETSLLNDIDTCCEKLSHLRARGVGIAIDDFGTGYSSMSYLAKLPLSTLKIDRQFVAEMAQSQQSRKIVNTILSLATELGLTVVAEGVEHMEDANYLMQQGCNYGQGFLYSKAVSLSNFLDMMENWDKSTCTFLPESKPMRTATG